MCIRDRYNAVINGWKDVEHQITFDVRQPKTHAYTCLLYTSSQASGAGSGPQRNNSWQGGPAQRPAGTKIRAHRAFLQAVCPYRMIGF